MPHYLRESHAIDRLTVAEISQCTSEFMQQKALHDDEGEPANGFDIIDINIAQAKRSAINLKSRRSTGSLFPRPSFVCRGFISRDASGVLGLSVWGNMINILSASAREARAAGRRKGSTMGCR